MRRSPSILGRRSSADKMVRCASEPRPGQPLGSGPTSTLPHIEVMGHTPTTSRRERPPGRVNRSPVTGIQQKFRGRFLDFPEGQALVANVDGRERPMGGVARAPELEACVEPRARPNRKRGPKGRPIPRTAEAG
jgi:hypothetical protein